MTSFLAPDVIGPASGTLLHGKRINMCAAEFGIYLDDGKPLAHSDLGSKALTTVFGDPPNAGTKVDTLSEPCFFAGLTLREFGHTLINATGRLWALDSVPDDVTLIFTPKKRPSKHFYPFVQPVLDLLGIKNPWRIIREPTRFEEIYTASDQFGERYDGRGSPIFYDWFDGRLLTRHQPEAGGKLYVSRSGLGAGAGRYACEDYLEELLTVEGYQIYHPEKDDLPTQIAAYQKAEHLIFAEGSALHLFAMVRQPSQKVSVIQRRAALPPLIQVQMNDRPGPDVLEINAIREIFWPPIRADHMSVCLLDFSQLGATLAAGGFISGRNGWQNPDNDVETTSLNAGIKASEKMLNAQERRVFLKEYRAKVRAKNAKSR
ncbi:glycosyltransferase 61 family protein [Cognatiyoonia sp. IB215446]|uniref:glycosyltransferase 61 family protein n=1 Tax=Cognatiyoonia sp. IB215446 TaxID=3097355 RepID=UPI002A10F0DD|nr:glycosyltransferase 61 family protein [Cognatiyoonia sp. IB215446]MDX8350074.1 glycosyltransferase 61 family protein [Cognatiyoonia sp. IB215446]